MCNPALSVRLQMEWQKSMKVLLSDWPFTSAAWSTDRQTPFQVVGFLVRKMVSSCNARQLWDSNQRKLAFSWHTIVDPGLLASLSFSSCVVFYPPGSRRLSASPELMGWVFSRPVPRSTAFPRKESECCRLNVCIVHKLIGLNPHLRSNGVTRWSLWMAVRHEDSVLTDGIVSLQKGPPESSSFLLLQQHHL